MTVTSVRTLVSSTRRSILLFSQNGLPMSSISPVSASTSCENAFCACSVYSWCRVSVSFLFSVEASNSHVPSRDQTPSRSKSCSVLYGTHSTTVTFHRGIVLLAGLVNGSSREAACPLLHSNVSFQKLTVDTRMCIFQCTRVTQVEWYPPGIVSVSQGEDQCTILVRACI